MSERHCVLLTCNRNHLKYALFVAWQLESNVRRDFDIVIASDKGDLESSLPDYIKFLHLTDVHIWKSIARHDRFSYYTYIRLPALEILSKTYSKVLHLDTDVFIATKTLYEIFGIRMTDYALCAVRDTQQRFRLNLHVPDHHKNGLTKSSYFNAGVLLVDCKNWIKQKTYKALIDALEKYPFPVDFHDQTLLNLVFYNNWLEMSPKWNWMGGPLTNFAAEYFSIRLYHGKTWFNDPKRVPPNFFNEVQLYNTYFNTTDKLSLEPASNSAFYREYWKSLALNLRWSFSCIRWLKRFENDFQTHPAGHSV